jgi:hypothetical protein
VSVAIVRRERSDISVGPAIGRGGGAGGGAGGGGGGEEHAASISKVVEKAAVARARNLITVKPPSKLDLVY